MHNRIFLLVFFILLPRWDCFYVPGVAPKEFKEGESIEVKAIKLTSIKTVVPYEYYSLPFCKSEKIHYKSENFGELLRGDRIVNTPYEISMKIDSKCKGLCHEQKTKRLDAAETDRLRKRIVEDYHVHLLVDNLPCATRYVVPETNEVFFDHGYKLGWTEGDKVFVNNHLEILLKYHEPQPGVYRVVGFEVQPKSISRDKFTFKEGLNDCTIGGEESQEVRAGENEIAWTYSVKWESSEVPWASRWDIYLSMKDVQIHWFSILNSVVVIACLTGFFSVIIIRTVRRDINKYNRDDEIEDTLEETGWKLVHGDVFRPPRYSMLLVNFVGTGIQLLVMTIAIISFAMLGMLSPSNRGSLTSVAIFVYCFMGLIAGYHSGRLYKTFRGNKPKRAAFRTATLFPGILFGIGFFLNFFLISKNSSGAGYSHPVRTNQIPRQVPDQPVYLKTIPCMLLAGILPFGAVFIELYFIFSAIWENQFYYLFGFLFIVCLILFVSCSLIAIIVTYFLLCAENYKWWWKSFVISGGSAVYVMLYSTFYYFSKLNIIGFVPTLLYFSYSFLIALTFWVLTGTIGFYAAYFFLRRIYGAVKID